MSFEQSIAAFDTVEPEGYHSFQFSLSSTGPTIFVEEIVLESTHNDVDDPTPHDAIVLFSTQGGNPLGSGGFTSPFGGLGSATIPTPGLTIGDEPVVFNIRLDQMVYGPNSWTLQFHLDNLVVRGAAPIPVEKSTWGGIKALFD